MLVYLCPADRKYACSWEGPSEDILHHFEEEHDELLHFNDTFNIDLSTSSENRLFFIDEEIYLIQINITDKKLEIKLRYLGPKKIAEKINYKIFLRINYVLCDPSYIYVDNGSIQVDLSTIDSLITNITCTLNINKDNVQEFFYNENINEESNMFQAITNGNRKLSLEENILINKSEVTLTRSKTITIEEIKRRQIKRAKSTLSLGPIIETNDSNCTECNVSLSPPIYLCPNGHNYCLKCRDIICKLCLERVTYERNMQLEEKHNKFLVPCRYKKNGCPEKLIYNDITDHTVNCSFCDYKCPISNCHFEGQYKHVLQHFKIIHGTTKILESFIVIFQNIPEAFLVNEEKGIFYCRMVVNEDAVKWEAIFCGPKERRFFCELKFKEGKLKQPVLLVRNESEYVYSIQISQQDLKKKKIKAKNAILTITS